MGLATKILVLSLAIAMVGPVFAASAEMDPDVRITQEGWCVLIDPANPPYVFVDPARCGLE